MRILTSLLFVSTLALGSVACNKGSDQPAATGSGTGTTTAAASPAQAEAEAIFKQRCVACHGDSGKGDGPGAAALNPKPASFSDAAWQKGITDEAIDKVILQGGGAVGKSPSMPPNTDLATKPDVIRALRAKVRSFGGG
jgi:mono/diheme cytochrome c family protein